MAIGKIPCRLNGSPIPNLADVGGQFTRNVNQRAVLQGDVPTVVISHGPMKPQVQLTFAVDEDKQYFVLASGSLLPDPPKFNLQIVLGSQTFNCINGIVQSTNPSSNQDGEASIQLTCMFEKIEAASS
jgi:hypothetical protein